MQLFKIVIVLNLSDLSQISWFLLVIYIQSITTVDVLVRLLSTHFALLYAWSLLFLWWFKWASLNDAITIVSCRCFKNNVNIKKNLVFNVLLLLVSWKPFALVNNNFFERIFPKFMPFLTILYCKFSSSFHIK